jgi:hypothetical protein
MQTFKIFIYEVNTGNVVEERDYNDSLAVRQEVLSYNEQNPTNKRNGHAGTEFPPATYTYDTDSLEFIKKPILQQVEDGDITLSQEQKVVDNNIVTKTLKEQLDEGIISIGNDEKIDEMNHNRILKKTNKELYEDNLLTHAEVYNSFLSKLNVEFDNKMKPHINYSQFEINGWFEKKQQAVGWLSLSDEEKRSSDAIRLYTIIIFESGANDTMSNQEYIQAVDTRANKVLEKAQEYETVYGNFLRKREETQSLLKEKLIEFESKESRDNNWETFESVLNNVEWNAN